MTRILDPERDIYRRSHVDVEGYEFLFYYPYEGESDLFKCEATTVSLSPYPEISLRDGFIILKYEKTIPEMNKPNAKEDLIKTVERDLNYLNQGIGFANSDADNFNKTLRSTALLYLSKKKENVESFYSVASMFEIPITKSTYATKHIPLKRNILPISHIYNEKLNYCISDKDYADILETIKHTGSTY